VINIKLLAFDQSTKITGYGLYNNSKLIEYGILQSDINEKNPIERMKQMHDKIKECLDKYNPHFVVFENVQFQKNYGTFQQLSQLQGLIMALLFERNIGFQYVESTAWRAFCGVKGKKRAEQKANAIQIVKDKFNLSVSDDEADAILIGFWGVNKILL
jgi:crossover junction endodeoxyribonuclease RuvC